MRKAPAQIPSRLPISFIAHFHIGKSRQSVPMAVAAPISSW
jgi:hypothetical protein